MKKKNGFIATSILYAFFIVFLSMLLSLIVCYVNNQVLLQQIENEAIENLSKYNGITLDKIQVGDYVKFPIYSNYDTAEVYTGEGNWVYAGTYDGYQYYIGSILNITNSIYVKLDNTLYKRYYPFTINAYTQLRAQGSTTAGTAFERPFEFNYVNNAYKERLTIEIPKTSILNKVRNSNLSDNIIERIFDDDTNFVVYNDINNSASGFTYKAYYELIKYSFSVNNASIATTCYGTFNTTSLKPTYDNPGNLFGYMHVDTSLNSNKDAKVKHIDYCYYAAPGNRVEEKKTYYFRLMAKIPGTVATSAKVSAGKGLENDPYIIGKG